MATKLPKLEGAGTAKINIRGEWFTDNNPVTMVNVYYNITYKMSTVLQVLINSSFQLQQSYSWAQRVQSPPYLQPLCDLPWDWVPGPLYMCYQNSFFFLLIFLWKCETIPVLLKPSQTITQCSYHPRVLTGLCSMASLLLLAFLSKECWDPAIFLSNSSFQSSGKNYAKL